MAGTSNFLQHNPTAANQETDGTYATDSTRTNGVTLNETPPSNWFNKLAFQMSTFVAALASVIANYGAGYTIEDTSIATLETQLAAFFAAIAGASSAGKIVATWSGASGTLIDSGNGGSCYESGATAWGTTIVGSYHILCTTTGWPSGSYAGDRCGWSVTATPIDGTTFSFAVNGAEISHARGSVLPSVTCFAIQ